jgi:membrane associated rhomboid family serine protease
MARTRPPDQHWCCVRCNTRVKALAALRRRARAAVARVIAEEVLRDGHPRGPGCPRCRRATREIRLEIDALAVAVDVCLGCDLALLDPGEVESIPPRAGAEPGSRAGRARGREPDSLVRFEGTLGPVSGGIAHEELLPAWKRLLAVLGLPVEIESPSEVREPWLTWSLAALLVAVFVVDGSEGGRFTRHLAFVPADWARAGGVTALTAFFVHSGALHLLGNLYFLLTFGDDVEDRFGRWRYAALLVSAGIAGSLVHGWLDPSPEVPLVGASGGLSGVLVCYAATFPWTRLVWFPPPISLVTWFARFSMPAIVFLFFWFVMQLFMALLQNAGATSISALAHLGGATVGMICWVLWRLESVVFPSRRASRAG